MVYKKFVESTSKFAIAQKYEAIFKYGDKTIHETKRFKDMQTKQFKMS